MPLQRKGIVYDVGTSPMPGVSTPPHFDAGQVRADLQVIADELHCTAVRITGADLDRMRIAAETAIDRGLEVWLSPMQHDATADELREYLISAAIMAKALPVEDGKPVVLILGWELTLFLHGLVPGDNLQQRIQTFTKPWRLIRDSIAHGSFNTRLNAVLQRVVPAVREHFSGPITYSSGTWEQVDWSLFDFVAIDCYRDRRTRRKLPKLLAGYQKHGKPVVATEFGCATYEGAADRGGMAWAIVDRSAEPPRLRGAFERSEREQANELLATLDVLEAGQVTGAFAFTFATWTNPYHPDPARDLDMAAYGIVVCEPDGSWRRRKQAFDVLARRYAAENLSP